MRAFLVVLAVVATAFLGIIAFELVRFDRTFFPTTAVQAVPEETREQHKARLERETDQSMEDSKIIFERALKTPTPQPSTQPKSQPAARP